MNNVQSEILKKYGIALLLQFGSSVTGDSHPGSDIDVGILFSNSGSVMNDPVSLYSDIRDFLISYFGTGNIDIVYLHEAPLALQFKAAHDGIFLYEKALGDYANYKEYVTKRYLDFRYAESIIHGAIAAS